MIAYKLVRIKNNKLYPLFINRNIEIPKNVWLTAECHATNGFAVRQGFHCCFYPYAPHLKLVMANGEQRVWVLVEVEDYITYQRPMRQGGAWVLAQRMKVLKVIDSTTDDTRWEKIIKDNVYISRGRNKFKNQV